MDKWHRITDVEPLGGWKVRCVFSDGLEGICDLSDFASSPAFEEWRTNPDLFAAVRHEDHALIWNEDLDVSGDMVRGRIESRGPKPSASS